MFDHEVIQAAVAMDSTLSMKRDRMAAADGKSMTVFQGNYYDNGFMYKEAALSTVQVRMPG